MQTLYKSTSLATTSTRFLQYPHTKLSKEDSRDTKFTCPTLKRVQAWGDVCSEFAPSEM